MALSWLRANLRIIAGKYRGLQLASPRGDRLRPTADKVRQAIFNIIGNDLSELWVLDLFAGTGAMGLEALSRGAAFVVLVDQHPTAMRLIDRNLAACGNPQGVTRYKTDLCRGLKGLVRHAWRFDLVFMDPPYKQGLSQRCLEELGGGQLLNPEATVISEHDPGEHFATEYGCLQHQETRRYGNTAVSFYQWEIE